MKNTPASFSLDQPRKINTIPNDFFTDQKIEALPYSAPPPTEEVLDHLNRIGHEYPFCVNNKQKMNDPL